MRINIRCRKLDQFQLVLRPSMPINNWIMNDPHAPRRLILSQKKSYYVKLRVPPPVSSLLASTLESLLDVTKMTLRTSLFAKTQRAFVAISEGRKDAGPFRQTKVGLSRRG